MSASFLVPGKHSMDVDSPSIIPGTPNADDYASLGDGDDLSRRTTPAFPNEEIVTGKVEEEEQKSSRHGSSGREEPTIHINGTLHQHDALQQSSLAVPILEMDLDNNEDEQFEVQPLAAHRMVSSCKAFEMDNEHAYI